VLYSCRFYFNFFFFFCIPSNVFSHSNKPVLYRTAVRAILRANFCNNTVKVYVCERVHNNNNNLIVFRTIHLYTHNMCNVHGKNMYYFTDISGKNVLRAAGDRVA
jgi:hypothetical protein